MQLCDKKIWYGSSLRPYPGNEPGYFEVKDFSWADKLEKEWKNWKEEITNLIKEKDTQFISTETFYEKMEGGKNWTGLMFLFWGMKISNDLKKKCPHLNQLLEKIPGLVSISLSRLNAHSVIAEHNGDTNAIVRCHVGLEIPAELPVCGFKVNGAEKSWHEGKCLLFNDAHKHSAWNNSDKRRIILILDVVRPEFLREKNVICAFILTRHVSYLYSKIGFIRMMPSFIRTALFASILGVVYLARPVYNLFK